MWRRYRCNSRKAIIGVIEEKGVIGIIEVKPLQV